MTTGFEPGQSLGIASVPNLRDLGGWPGRDGTVKPGVLFRSANFAGLAGDDLAAFDRLGIATVYDFRTEGERQAQPDTLPVGVEYVVLDVMRDSKSQSAALMLKLASGQGAPPAWKLSARQPPMGYCESLGVWMLLNIE